jgi:transposase-like protein
MKFSLEFKENIVKKVLDGGSVRTVAGESGLSTWSIYQWLKACRGGRLKSTEGPGRFSLSQKQDLLLESKGIAEDALGEWLRKTGLHSDHLEKWKKEIGDAMDKNSAEKIENQKLKHENDVLMKELARKDKALAELAALLTLKKKYQHLWEGEEK